MTSKADSDNIVATTALIQLLLWRDRKKAARTDLESHVVTGIEESTIGTQAARGGNETGGDSDGKAPQVSSAKYVGTSQI